MAAHTDSGQVRIDLLGGFRVALDGREIEAAQWPSRRPAQLVQVLALAEHHSLLRDQVIETLWPHLRPEAGAANLRKAAHLARKALDSEDAVVLSEGRVALFPLHRVATDVESFESRGAAALRSGDRGDCVAAAGAYPGVLLPDSLYEDWTAARREHLRSLQIQLLRRAEQWERLVELEPCDEQAYRQLMRTAVATGNRPAAIRWYGRLRTNLQRELGVAPGPESQALYRRCVAGLEPAATAFVGRQLELARAEVALRSAEQAAVGALVVRGPAGIGKSALCGQAASLATGRGWSVVKVTASSGLGPYAPLVSAIEQILHRDRTRLEAVGNRARATLAALTRMAGPRPREATGLTRHQVIGAVRRLFAAGGVGVLLVIDDAHLADAATVDVCAQLARAAGGVSRALGNSFLVGLAYRPELAPQALTDAVASLARAGLSVEIDLGPLGHDEVVALAQAGAATRLDAGALGAIVEMAHGNPFFILEVARSLGRGTPVAVPRSIWAAVTTRFLDLDEAAAAFLRRLAVAGDDIDPAEVPALSGLSEHDAFALLDTALATGALIVSGAHYRFRHELVRQALIEQVPPHQRIAWHRDSAGRLAAAGAAPALIARHWLEGRRPDAAAEWLLAAARTAMSLGAYADAVGHLEPLLDHDPEHAEALRLRAEALDALGDRRAPDAYAAAARVAGEPACNDLWAKQALAQLKQGDPAAALRTLQDIEPVTAEGRLAQALTWSGAAAMGLTDPAIGRAQAAECRRLALQTGDNTALAIASWAQAAAAHARGDLRSSLRADLSDTHALRELAISVFDGQLCIIEELLYGARPYPDVIAFADAFAAEAERLTAARGQAFALTLRGEAELLSGKLDEADADLSKAARLSRAIGAAVGEALALQRRAEVALYGGRTRDADALLEEALAVARESDAGFHLLDRIYGTKIAVSGSLAAVEEAEAAVRGPTETCPGCRITLAVPAAIVSARAGDLDRAARYAESVQTLASVVMRLPAWDAAVEEVEGHLAQARGDDAGAATHFRAAADRYRACGQPLDEDRCTRSPAAWPDPGQLDPARPAGNVSGTPA